MHMYFLAVKQLICCLAKRDILFFLKFHPSFRIYPAEAQ